MSYRLTQKSYYITNDDNNDDNKNNTAPSPSLQKGGRTNSASPVAHRVQLEFKERRAQANPDTSFSFAVPRSPAWRWPGQGAFIPIKETVSLGPRKGTNPLYWSETAKLNGQGPSPNAPGVRYGHSTRNSKHLILCTNIQHACPTSHTCFFYKHTDFGG